MGYTIGAKAEDLSYDPRDSAPYVPRSVIVDPTFQWGTDAPPETDLADTLLYEAHVKGMTAEFPGLTSVNAANTLAWPASRFWTT